MALQMIKWRYILIRPRPRQSFYSGVKVLNFSSYNPRDNASSSLHRFSSSSSTEKYTHSYVHKLSTGPLVGKTIGNCLEDTANRFPERDAVIFCRDGVRRNFATLKEEVDKIAAGLLAIGIKKGDRVGIWGPSTLEWVLTQFSTARFGAILVNINPAYRTEELNYALNKVGCKAIVSAKTFKSQDYYSMLSEICPELETAMPGDLQSKRVPSLKSVIMMGDDDFPGSLKFNDLYTMGTSEHFSIIEDCKTTLQFDEPINIQFTSGTTGNPKGVTLSHHNIVNNCVIVGRQLDYHLKHHKISIPVPLYHCFGMVLGSLATAVHGATAIFGSPSFEPEATLQAIQNEKCTSQYGTPTMFIDMLHHPNFDQYDLTSLTTGIMAGSPCPIETMKQVNTKMHMKDVTICYGLTETSPVTFQCEMDDPIEKRVSTVGRPSPHNEVKVIDPDTGAVLPINTPGELCSRGYTTMLGYWEDEENTKKAVDGNRWFHTGDLATIDEEGFGKIVGRIKDLIIRGGENIYPTEIEQFLYKHPKIEDVQVIGIPDERLGEEVCAWVKLKADQTATEEEIKQFCKGNISHFKIPKIIHFVDSFPLTVTGKVQKYIMRKEMETYAKK
ncbi:medium-chain acyl-CoA ligase ACSF2, mitochondrial-like [Anneissia japonica]|uniref:medium-chain acyl-CoA ligase ACSF2, mitochondrial-like n=1 Tax=Anneissia japonica TaxID=1529436 RepID=UPI001425910C|nr:medium-chain acyl-CoA ligase ACSF2, mitochondrial-like [Anneissia japonica]